MTQQRDYKGELRAAFTMREIENAERSICHTGASSIFIRVALAVIYMYLIVISYMMLGNIGPVFISVLSLAAYFIPYLYQAIRDRLAMRRQQKTDRNPGQELAQKA